MYLKREEQRDSTQKFPTINRRALAGWDVSDIIEILVGKLLDTKLKYNC